MNILVLLKQTFDTEEKITIVDGVIAEDGVKFVINPYDEYAVEQAIQIREELGGKVTVVSVGPERSAEALRTALAMGADEAVLISDDRICGDEYEISQILAAYASEQAYDLILAGNFSVDNGAGQVAVRLGKLLNLPHVASITKLLLANDNAIVNRDVEGDLEVIEVSLPALFTAQQGLCEPRYPSLPGIMKAKKKPFQFLTLNDLVLGDITLRTTRIGVSLSPKRPAGRILLGELEHQVKELAHLLRNESTIQ